MAGTVNEDILVDRVRNAFRDDIIETTVFRGEVTHVVKTRLLTSLCAYLKTDLELRMNYLVDVLGVDYPDRSPRFEVVYHLYSTSKKHRLRLKVRLDEGETVQTVTSIWRSAGWPERETYDMFGIVFEGHENLRRIYLADDWEGFPLRKDYPLRGYKDRYNPYGEEK
jgi:NADH-quinone oxidoreductase subunit C